ncbi:MAG: hypothetical protein LBD31_04635 [Treponema sp.]|nr:hypothetical protein [Treponema sp.]
MKSFKRRLGALTALLVLLAGAGVFFLRRPVVMVSDEAFGLLYGESRALVRRVFLSAVSFRRIRSIELAEGAGPDLAAQAAASLSRRPLAVFFPFRYRDGARRYLRNRPGSTVVILGGRNSPETEAGEGEPLWFSTDLRTDLYRAGVCAAAITGSGGSYDRLKVALYEKGLEEGDWAAFSGALEDQRWTGQPYFLSPGENIPPEDLAGGITGGKTEPDCTVILGREDFDFLNTRSPLILFTWTDPALLPRNTAVVFDDSPWAQLGPALAAVQKGEGGGLIPSKITLPGYNRDMEKDIIEINRIKRLKYEGKNTDN